MVAERGWDYLFAHDPRAEWYANAMTIPGSPAHRHHRSRWGRLGRYESFGQLFRQGLRDWDPSVTLGPLAGCGARYLVATAKHHDGFTMWPSRRRNPRRRGWQSARDVLGEIAEGVSSLGMRFGVYYSSGLDWTFGGTPIRSLPDVMSAIPRSRSYAAYVDAHWRELISRYSPSVLWSDVGSPASEDLLDLFSEYYGAVPDGVVNDRFGQPDPDEGGWLGRRALSALRRYFPFGGRLPAHARGMHPARHADFHTVDGEVPAGGIDGAWECVRSLGYSAGFSAEETEDHLLPVSALVRLLCDVTARGGNLLLSVGPKADGSLGAPQCARLRGLGEWLKLNGEAIYGTRPWGDGEGTTGEGVELRFTAKGMTAYAILLGTPAGRTIVLPSLRLLPYASVRVPGSVGFVTWHQEGKDVHIRLSEPLRDAPAHVISITPAPR